MSLIEVLLSSAVIVAVIQYFQGEKNNKLQYITEERAKWRKEIKEIISEIRIADFQTIEKCLTDLGKNLNAYGYCPDGKYEKNNLDFFQDEHIWREIDIIKKAVNEHNTSSFNKSKENIIHYLFLLLKFDWERSKQEIKGEKAIPVSIALFGLSLIISIFSVYSLNDIQENPLECFIFSSVISMMYVFSWIIYGTERIEILKEKKWYLKIDRVLASWLVAAFELVGLFILEYKWENLGLAIPFMAVAVLLIPCLMLSKKEMYRKYDKKINQMLNVEVNVYQRRNNSKMKTNITIGHVGITVILLIYLIFTIYVQEIAASILSTITLIIIENKYFGEQKMKIKLQKAVEEEQKLCLNELRIELLKKYADSMLALISLDFSIISMLYGTQTHNITKIIASVVFIFFILLILGIVILAIMYKHSSVDNIIFKLCKENMVDHNKLTYVSGNQIKEVMNENN